MIVIWNQSRNTNVFSFLSQHQPPQCYGATSINGDGNGAPAAVLGAIELVNAGAARRKREAEAYAAADLIIELPGMGIVVAGDTLNLAGRRRGWPWSCLRPGCAA